MRKDQCTVAQHLADVAHRATQKHTCFMQAKDRVFSGNVKVGDRVCRLHAPDARDKDASFTDLYFLPQQITVVEVKRNGTIVLGCGDKFYPNGFGHARNNLCVLSDRPVFVWNHPDLSKAEAEELLEACRKAEKDQQT